ncbi:UDP-N-acetyl-D-glucosamine 6-dehydrogenase-like protein [Emericellopsis cladophorae]|uniref:UDP-N-acetyl-D-glucosamine 6-dehydrogenase-like protein n=1 Tax=Emericellopsis cladophorae TaxID=2686198 RepID=A0A9P9Y6Z0_9HYPO|nr:UDP-N-acetyl-D-glucosamine 6-dehydrogenase-like protein [Emericellopsis cladophorae]KAI6784738.1 UDP-N-acetyl-D-glucosamine 6-dehydrogenase-like protein [Emericellopsis cladophorae]
MATVLSAETKHSVLIGVQDVPARSFVDASANHDEYPWSYLTADTCPSTPPTSVSDCQTEISRPPSPVRPDDQPIVAVLGVGYVGSHLVESFSKCYDVIGFDVSHARVRQLREDYAAKAQMEFTDNARNLSRATHFLISVPTLLRPDRTIDSSYLREAIKSVGQVARRGSTVVVESSVAVGMTRQLLGPLAQASGFFAGMSPERVDPGRVDPPVQAIPKIISGLDDMVPGSLDAIHRVYRTIFDNVVTVSKPEVAEMMKLYENCQRMVCIAYANEMADACISHDIDPYEVCNAASTKPFGYMPYAPGVGVGGHCIPVNPFYLLSNNSFPLLEAATSAMWSRPAKIADRALELLRRLPKRSASPRVLVAGMAFKAGQTSLSNSPGLDLAKSLAISQEAEVIWADALVHQDAIPHIPRLADSEWTVEGLETFDLVIVALKQREMDFTVLNELRGTNVEMWCR